MLGYTGGSWARSWAARRSTGQSTDVVIPESAAPRRGRRPAPGGSAIRHQACWRNRSGHAGVEGDAGGLRADGLLQGCLVVPGSGSSDHRDDLGGIDPAWSSSTNDRTRPCIASRITGAITPSPSLADSPPVDHAGLGTGTPRGSPGILRVPGRVKYITQAIDLGEIGAFGRRFHLARTHLFLDETSRPS